MQERVCEGHVPYNQRLHVASSVSYTAVLDVRRATAKHLAKLLRGHREQLGTRNARARWASHDCRKQVPVIFSRPEAPPWDPGSTAA